MFTKRIFLIIVTAILFVNIGMTQKIPPKMLKVKGDLFYDNQKYVKALPYYIKYQEVKPRELDIKLRIGICYYETNRTEQAITYLTYMAQQKKPEPSAYLYLAKSYHLQHQFDEAIKFYKKYLSTLEPSDNQKYPVKDDIRRCSRGKKLQYSDKLALVENLGDKVNTSGDDFAPVMSPTASNVLYFSSIRSENIGGIQEEYGLIDTIKGEYRSDIFRTKLDKGVWLAADRLGGSVNTEAHDVIFSFNNDGSTIFYGISKYKNFDYSNVYSKPFKEEVAGDIPFKFPIEVNSGEWDADAYFYNDTILIFSSDRPGGFGGKDLYISFKDRKGKWMDGINLGSEINGPYDEITPYLSNDGKTLYFSSNNVNGMGGFDIYQSVFDHKAGGWSSPSNMGMPINSAGNDAYFRISDDGMRAYLSSSRSSGYGGYDIYVGYFRRLMKEQLAEKAEPTMVKHYLGEEIVVPVAKIDTPIIVDPEIEDPVIDPTTPTFVFMPLFYQNVNDLLLTPKSVSELNKMKDLLNKYPTLKVELTGHTDSYAPQNFNLQNSLKNTESIAEYLIANGVSENRIVIKGVGQIYPIAMDTNDDGSENKQGRVLNRRVHMETYNEEDIPLVVRTEIPRISASLAMSDGKDNSEKLKGLTYRVQVKALKQTLDDNVLIRYPDALVETTPTTEFMRYSVGLVKTFAEAEAIRLKLVADGFKDAFIVGYINGERLEKSSLKKYETVYTDLVNFLEE